jgi:hypothetical protein
MNPVVDGVDYHAETALSIHPLLISFTKYNKTTGVKISLSIAFEIVFIENGANREKKYL